MGEDAEAVLIFQLPRSKNKGKPTNMVGTGGWLQFDPVQERSRMFVRNHAEESGDSNFTGSQIKNTFMKMYL